jgi:phosphoenolpyruvate carboxykinase (ATP)
MKETQPFSLVYGTGKQRFLQTQKKIDRDDEHGWTNENTVFNFEGGCYAKVINLGRKRTRYFQSQ